MERRNDSSAFSASPGMGRSKFSSAHCTWYFSRSFSKSLSRVLADASSTSLALRSTPSDCAFFQSAAATPNVSQAVCCDTFRAATEPPPRPSPTSSARCLAVKTLLTAALSAISCLTHLTSSSRPAMYSLTFRTSSKRSHTAALRPSTSHRSSPSASFQSLHAGPRNKCRNDGANMPTSQRAERSDACVMLLQSWASFALPGTRAEPRPRTWQNCPTECFRPGRGSRCRAALAFHLDDRRARRGRRSRRSGTRAWSARGP
mmetsp:Transcript_5247/g.19046  ORF Transcript_5247/g.19046 Transcript_5247/m.19046 type:complete len:260 (+) Transcript_5247:254-1033(+)